MTMMTIAVTMMEIIKMTITIIVCFYHQNMTSDWLIFPGKYLLYSYCNVTEGSSET